MTYTLDEQVGQLQDTLYVDNLQAKNGFYICEGLLKKEKQQQQQKSYVAYTLKYPLTGPLQKKFASLHLRIILLELLHSKINSKMED